MHNALAGPYYSMGPTILWGKQLIIKVPGKSCQEELEEREESDREEWKVL